MASKPLQLKFVQSATRVHQLPELGPEVAFVGRSNVGKSSLINALAHQRQLARVSNTPGRTQLINVFSHVAGGAVVDLPGYGYAKVPGHIRGDWSSMIEGYLLEREELVMVFVLVDGEIGPTPLDVQMLEWLRYSDVPHTVVATKSDKVKSISCPTAETMGMLDLAIARATISSLKHQRSSSDPPPRPTIKTSTTRCCVLTSALA